MSRFTLHVEAMQLYVLILLAILGCCQCAVPKVETDLNQTFVTVPEDIAIDSTLFLMTITDTDENELIQIQLDNSDTADMVWLDIDPDQENRPPLTVIVRVRRHLDRDYPEDGTYQLEFRVTDTQNNVVNFNVPFYLTDVNDNAPMFENLPYSWSIPENATVSDTVYTTITASDIDNGDNSAVLYNMTPSTQSSTVATEYESTFSMIQANGLVTLRKPLDYESNSYYQFTVNATDRGIPPKSSTAVFIIRVLDVQDTPPFFTGIPYRSVLSENNEAITSVLSVTAVDGDHGIPNEIRYNITGGTCSDMFVIHENGTITTNQLIDRDTGALKENGNICDLKIQAVEIDNDPTEQYGDTTAETTVTITVLDENDNSPMFNGSNFTTRVQENTPAGIPVTVTNLFVEDIDQGVNGTMFMYMTFDNGTNITDFEVQPSKVVGEAPLMIWILNNDLLDHEIRESIRVLIIAKEEANSGHVATATVVIEIEDINDCDPRFKNDSYEFYTKESLPSGSIVGNITATDEDSGIFGNITYAVFGGNGRFEVDAYSGELSVNCSNCPGQLDREKIDTYYLTFTATDGGGRTRAVPVQVHLTDINDNAPTFLRATYEEIIDENTTCTNPIVTVEAQDADVGENADIFYNITSVHGIPEANIHQFNITEDGSIYLADTLDYEYLTTPDGSVTLMVTVTDGGHPSLNSTVNVTLRIQDINDNRPIFNETLYTGNITENETSPAEVSIKPEIAASDLDGTRRNAQFRYFITAGSFDQFTINATSGVVAVQVGKTLDRDLRPAYNLTIEAIDQGYPPLTGTTTLSINVEDVNDKDPKFEDPSYTEEVHETKHVDTVVTVVATDSDIDANLTYSITTVSAVSESGSQVNESLVKHYFNIGPTNGIITASVDTDRETAKVVHLTIQVEDISAYFPKPQTATAEVTITLLDVNDNDPVFDIDQYLVNVSENAENGPIIATLRATDLDENRTITYTIRDESHQIPFCIDPETGALSKAGDIDREINSTIEFNVMAVDSGVPPRNTSVTVTVTVLDFNDNAPEFTNASYTISVSENATIGASVLTVIAEDIDEGRNSEIIYSIENEQDFHINNETGLVTVAKQLDRETKGEYTFRVIAKDNPVDPALQKSTQTVVTIHIEDINDNPPNFTQSLYTTNIREDIAVDTVVATVSATDMDENKALNYSFGSEPELSLFSIAKVANAAQIKVNTSLKSYTRSYVLVVVAEDSGGLTGTATVNITVTDVNLNHPQIVNIPKDNTLQMYECARVGTEVYQFDYTDADKGKNAEAFFNLSKIQPDDNVLQVFDMRENGSLVTRTTLDVKIQHNYRFQISATDRGDPVLSSDKITIEVQVLDVDDHAPTFNKSERHFSVSENKQAGTLVGVLTAYDEDLNSKQCFSLVTDEGKSSDFIISYTDGQITTKRELDWEQTKNYTFKVNVTDCSAEVDRDSSCDNVSKTDDGEIPRQTIIVNVLDLDDNPPKFVHREITLGIRRVTEVGTILPLSLRSDGHVTDLDSAPNGRDIWKFRNYGDIEPGPSVVQVPEASGTEACSDNIQHIFCVSMNGSVINNKFFSEDVSGYFNVPIFVSDGAGNDTAVIKIFLIGDSQILRMTLFGNKEKVAPQRESILQAYSDITGHTFVYDWIEDHKTAQGTVETFKSDLYFHVVEQDTNRILSDVEALRLVDSFAASLQAAALEHKVLQIVASEQTVTEESSSKTIYILGAVIAALGVTVIAIIYVAMTTRSSYKRKLKAATVASRPGKDLEKKVSTSHVPGSNMYSKTSNPLLNAEVKPDTLDNISLNSNNSLDSNDVDTAARINETVYDRIEEREVTLDMYTEDGPDRTPEESALDAALRLHEQQNAGMDREPSSPQEMAFINEGYDDDLESTEI